MKLLPFLLIQLLHSARSISSGGEIGSKLPSGRESIASHKKIPEAIQSPRYLINEHWNELGEGIGGEKLDDLAGHRVATNKDGTIIAVSSPKWIKPGYNREPFGRVRVYKFEPETNRWRKMGSDIVGEELDEFGTALAMDADGKNIVVGMINDTEMGRDSGSVRVYTYDDNSGEIVWIKKGELLTGRSSFEEFGAAVDISDDGRMIAVGAPNADVGIQPDTEEEAGAVRVFRYEPNANNWIKVGEDLEGLVKFDHFGAAVSISGDGFCLAIGAPHALDYNTGEVRIFHFNDTTFKWDPKGTIAGENLGDMFGSSVSLYYNPDTKMAKFIAGAPHHDGGAGFNRESGQARVFINENSMLEDPSWKMQGQAIAGLEAGDLAGSSVYIAKETGTEIAIGSPNSSQNGRHSGHANVWYFDEGSNEWIQQGLDIDGANPLDLMGNDVALSHDGQELIAGAPGGQYAKIYGLAATRAPTDAPTIAPTMAPTPRKKNKDKKSSNGFVRFLRIIAIGGLIALLGVGIYKAILIAMRRRHARTLIPNTHELELQSHPSGRAADRQVGDESDEENEML